MTNGSSASAFPAILLFVVGGLLFASGALGIWKIYPDAFNPNATSVSPIGVYTVTWSTASSEVATRSPTTFENPPKQTFVVTNANVTELKFTINCNDNPNYNAQFPFKYTVKIEGPNITTKEESNVACAPGKTFMFPITPVPQTNSTSGDTPKKAQDALPRSNATRGTGTYTVTITGSRANVSGPITTVVPPPNGSIRLDETKWAAKLEPVPK